MSSSGAHQGRVVESLKLLPDVIDAAVASTCTAPPKSHTCSKGRNSTNANSRGTHGEHLAAAVARAQHVQALYVAVDDVGQVQVINRRRRLARGSQARVRSGRRIAAQTVVPAATRHPLHDDKGVRRLQAGAEDLHAVRVVHLHALSHCRLAIFGRAPHPGHGCHFMREAFKIARVERDLVLGTLQRDFGSVLERAQHDTCATSN